MKIQYRVGDLLNHPGQFIMHSCNAQGVMGSGVALAIRNRYPKNFEIYAARHAQKPLMLGEVIAVDCGIHTVLNGICQEFYGRDGKRYVSYDAVEQAMLSVNELAKHTGESMLEVGLPRIGADLGGGDWNIISALIEETATDYQPIVYVLDEKFIPVQK